MKLAPALALAAGLVLASACSEDTAGPVAGVLSVDLATPNTDDGAVLFTISGTGIDSVAAAGYQVHSGRLDPKTLRVIVTGDLVSGSIARLYIADTRQAAGYRVTLDQVAARASYQQRDPSIYTITLTQ